MAFLIARYGARDKVAEMAKRNRRFGAIDRAIAEGGWKIVGLSIAIVTCDPVRPTKLSLRFDSRSFLAVRSDELDCDASGHVFVRLQTPSRRAW